MLFIYLCFGHATWLAGSQFPDKGLNPSQSSEVWNINHWIAEEVPNSSLGTKSLIDLPFLFNQKSVIH